MSSPHPASDGPREGEHADAPWTADRDVARRLGRLAVVTNQLLAAESEEQVGHIVAEHMTDAAGAAIGALSLLVDDDTLALVSIKGAPEHFASRWATYSVHGNTPAAEAVRRREPLVLVGRATIAERYPELGFAADGERSFVCLPLVAGGRALGVVNLSFAGRHQPGQAELQFYRLLADTCAHAVDRIRALDDAADREAKLSFLAAASDKLASDLDHEKTLVAVTEMAVPWFADWCSISLAEDGRLRPLSVAHRQPELSDLVADLLERYPADPSSPRGSYHVLRTAQSDLIPEVTDDLLVASAQNEEHLAILRRLEFRSALVCPLISRDRVLGVITWVAGVGGRRFDADDLAFGEDLARRAAVAIDNAELHSQVRDVALQLQQAVLPDQAPVLAGFEASVLYEPAGRTAVGGDFYDVVPLEDGRVAAFVGDVMGRGVHAAAVMAQVRSAMRTLVVLDPDPASVLTCLDTVVARLGFEPLVSVGYAVADPVAATLTVASSGHPPPVLVDPVDGARLLTMPESPMIGVLEAPERPDAVVVPLRTGARFLLFSDGLVERRDEDIDRGLDRLVAACARAVRSDGLQAWLDAVVAEVHDPGRDDDVAVLAVQVTA